LEHLPPTVHLVLATRADPPLPLARLRARGQVVELRANELRFTPEEASAFLTDTMRLPLTPAEVAALETRTEGWIVGLQLAALAMQDRSDLAGFVSAFTGSNRFVMDFLAEEVLARQPAHLQAFLLNTSILARMCGPLCDAVIDGMPPGDRLHTPEHSAPGVSEREYDARSILQELERANLFTVALDDTRTWYRYHHLFAEVLRERLLDNTATEKVAALHRRAAAWHEQ